jgi:hypothetical protein
MRWHLTLGFDCNAMQFELSSDQYVQYNAIMYIAQYLRTLWFDFIHAHTSNCQSIQVCHKLADSLSTYHLIRFSR